jgi:hypothetical protein
VPAVLLNRRSGRLDPAIMDGCMNDLREPNPVFVLCMGRSGSTRCPVHLPVPPPDGRDRLGA